MQCENVRSQFTDYVTDSLAEAERSEIQQHLMDCEACRDETEAMQNIWMKLDSIPNVQPDSNAMRARFEVMLEAYQHGMDHAPKAAWWDNVNGWIGRLWPRQPALQFGLTIALLVAGVIAGRQYRPAAQPQAAPAQSLEMTQLRDELHDMRQMVALSLMQQQSASDRLKGVSFSNQIDRPNSEMLNALMDTLMHDPNVNVRLAAVDALKKYGEQTSVHKDMLQALAKQDSPFVQVALIDYVVEMGEKDSVDTLRKISQDNAANESVRKRAEWGLEQLR